MSERSGRAVESLAEFLLYRDWPNAEPRDSHLRYTYRTLAAAITAGEAWAIRKAWPDAAYDIETRSNWSGGPC